MKKILSVLSIFVLSFASSNAQITLDYRTDKTYYLTKFYTMGYKYVQIEQSPLSILIYNLDHSLNRTIIVPGTYSSGAATRIGFVTDRLFDLDGGIEYAVNDVSSPTYNYIFRIYNEDGSLIMSRDSAALFISGSSVPNALGNENQIFYDGISTKMRLYIQSSSPFHNEYYTLPGSIPCVDCNQGIITGINVLDPTDEVKALFYPNPVSEYLRLKYELPPGAKHAYLKVYDITGKQVQDMEITNTFDYIYLPANYNNGLYLYTLIVDDKIIKTEKIILEK